jgi:ABC-2 type transport system permease protein
MAGAVFIETLRRQWKGMLWWGLGIGSLALLDVIIVPSVDALRQMAAMMETLPPFLMQAFGAGDIRYLATPEGYLAVQYFGFMLLIFAIYAVMLGLNVTSNDEERGTMDMFLSLPIARWRLLLEKFVAYSLLIAGVILLSFLCMWLGIVITPALATVEIGKIAVATFAMLPASLLMLAFTILVSVIVRRRGQAIALASVFVIASYFIDTLGRAASDTILAALRGLSLFAYYDGIGLIQHGLVWGNMVVLAAATLVLVGGGIWFFQRRDVGL